MANSMQDITKPIDLLQHASGTGHLRNTRPLYVDLMPPCNSACPAGENIQAWLAYATEGQYEQAFRQIMEDNPFPALMGRICVKPCETGCNRNHIDETVNIHAVERYIGDEAIAKGWTVEVKAPPTGKRVMVVGAGPGGLSAAYHLRMMGHEVEIFEAEPEPGGLLYLGVPEYRLPREVLKAEIKRILALGIKLHVNYRVANLESEMGLRSFDAAYISTGSHAERAYKWPGTAKIPFMDAIEFLRYFRTNTLPHMGENVMIYGGGKLAMYIARVVRRLGKQPVVLYPGDRKTMPAYDFEADDAIAEGVDVQMLRSITNIEGREVSVSLMQMVKGKPEPTGEELVMHADAIVIAMGQQPDSALYSNLPGADVKADGGLAVNNQTRMTGRPGIFAGGDMLTGEQRSSTVAIGHGKKAARNIDAWLRNEVYEKPAKPQTAGYKRLHMWFKTDAPAAAQPRLSPVVAIRNFEEVVTGISREDALYEAQRCLSCGNCFECDGCYGACPEDAIIKLGKGNRYAFNYDACTGCGICYEQCPCHAIEMIPEPQNDETK